MPGPICEHCHGVGRVPRLRRTIDGVVDPLDFQFEELCPMCSGAGVKPPQTRATMIAEAKEAERDDATAAIRP